MPSIWRSFGLGGSKAGQSTANSGTTQAQFNDSESCTAAETTSAPGETCSNTQAGNISSVQELRTVALSLAAAQNKLLGELTVTDAKFAIEDLKEDLEYHRGRYERHCESTNRGEDIPGAPSTTAPLRADVQALHTQFTDLQKSAQTLTKQPATCWSDADMQDLMDKVEACESAKDQLSERALDTMVLQETLNEWERFRRARNKQKGSTITDRGRTTVHFANHGNTGVQVGFDNHASMTGADFRGDDNQGMQVRHNSGKMSDFHF